MILKLAAISAKTLAKLEAPVKAAMHKDKTIFDAFKNRSEAFIEKARATRITKQNKTAFDLDELIMPQDKHKKTKLINDLYRASDEFKRRMNKAQDLAHGRSKIKKFEEAAVVHRDKVKPRYERHAEYVKNENKKTAYKAGGILGGSALVAGIGSYYLGKKKRHSNVN